MNISHKLFSALSASAIALSAGVPALAYVPVDTGLTNLPEVERIQPASLFHFNQVHNRPITSRAIRGNRKQNSLRHRVGQIRTRGGERSEAVPDTSGRVRLPVRSEWRQPFTRGEVRRQINSVRGGYRHNLLRARRSQGDVRRRPGGKYRLPGARRSVTSQPEAYLPPSLVRTGGGSHPNWRRWARGDRDLNGYNRYNMAGDY